jgi:hypothetical protein
MNLIETGREGAGRINLDLNWDQQRDYVKAIISLRVIKAESVSWLAMLHGAT